MSVNKPLKQAKVMGLDSLELPVRVPFETRHVQVFTKYELYKGTFANSLLSTKGGGVKQLEYYIEYDFTPEKKNRGRKPNDPAMMNVHLFAVVTDLQPLGSEANSRPSKAQLEEEIT